MYFLYPTSTGRDFVKKTGIIVLVVILLLILFWGTILPAAADDEPFIPVTAPLTEEPTELPTVQPPTAEPTELPTIKPPTEEPTITIWTNAPVMGGGKGYVDTYCNVDGASVSFDGQYECTIAQGICTVAQLMPL